MPPEQQHGLMPTGQFVTPETAAVLTRAEESARRFGSSSVGTDHLLLGCVEHFALLFAQFQVNTATIEGQIAHEVDPDLPVPEQLAAGRLALQVFAIAGNYATHAQDVMRPEHIMIALFDRQEQFEREHVEGTLPVNLFPGVPRRYLPLIHGFMVESLAIQGHPIPTSQES